MDTKLRSNDGEREFEMPPDSGTGKKPSKWDTAKGLAIIFAISLSVAMLISAAAYFWHSMYSNQNFTSLQERIRTNYTTSEELIRQAKNLNRYLLYYDGAHFEQRAAEEDFITDEDMWAKQDQLYREYSQKLTETENSTSNFEERKSEVAALSAEYNYSDEDLREMIIQDKRENYVEIKAYLESFTGMHYYIHDSVRNEYYTNMPILPHLSQEDYAQQATWYVHKGEYNPEPMSLDEYYESDLYLEVFYLDDPLFQGISFNNRDLGYSFGEAGYTGSIFILRGDLTQYNDFTVWVEELLHDMYKRTYYGENLVLLVGSLVSLLFFVTLANRNKAAVKKGNSLLLKLHSWLPFTFKVAGAFAALALLMEAYSSYVYMYWHVEDMMFFLGLCAVLHVALVITLEYIFITLRNLRRLKNEPEITFVKWFFRSIKFVFLCKSPVVMVAYAAVVFFSLIGLYISIEDWGPAFLLITAAAALVGHLFIVEHARLVFYIHEMAEGRLEGIARETGRFSVRELSHISTGITAEVNRRIKSERLKTELITNVSHDLKTPLTSIISYVALLKELPWQSPEAVGYIDVLDKKSERLKVLIEDLFEATKLNSGNVELNLQRANVVNLINQTLGELSEKISESGLTFRFKHSPEHIYMTCDGNKLYRVFENLIGNILKYSQPGSRAYIDAEEDIDYEEIRITFRSMSAYELDANPDELFHRFKRGDASRTTEGSGLGLTIARSIVELHGGKMSIEIDGDLFKVTVVFPS